MEWNFDDQTPKYTNSDTWDNIQNRRESAPCATSSSGKLFLYSGNIDSKMFSILGLYCTFFILFLSRNEVHNI